MASPEQLAANRRNAEKSTGPRTPEGKAVSRLNALKSGIHAEIEIVPNFETKAELDTLKDEFYKQFDPATPEERSLLDIVVRSEWLLRRMANAESSFWLARTRRLDEMGELPLGKDILGKDFTRIQWRINTNQRALYTALDRLKALQAERAERQPQDPEPLPDELASFREVPSDDTGGADLPVCAGPPDPPPAPEPAEPAEAAEPDPPAHSRFGEPGPQPPAPAASEASGLPSAKLKLIHSPEGTA